MKITGGLKNRIGIISMSLIMANIAIGGNIPDDYQVTVSVPESCIITFGVTDIKVNAAIKFEGSEPKFDNEHFEVENGKFKFECTVGTVIERIYVTSRNETQLGLESPYLVLTKYIDGTTPPDGYDLNYKISYSLSATIFPEGTTDFKDITNLFNNEDQINFSVNSDTVIVGINSINLTSSDASSLHAGIYTDTVDFYIDF